MLKKHRYFLEQALLEARKAEENGQVPVGCVVVDANGAIIARNHNRVNEKRDRSAHAEMLAIRDAIASRTTENADGWKVYVTLEPCPMCLGTIVMCNIGAVIWAAPDRHIDTHRLLMAIPYLQTRRLVTVASPFLNLEHICSQMHDDYWIRKGRPDVVSPIYLDNTD